VAAVKAESSVSWTYDVLNRKVTEAQQVVGQTARVAGYQYDADGHPVDYGYTARHEIGTVTADGPPPLATYSYNLAGEMTELMRENGVRTVTGYDLAGRQTGVTHQIGLSVLDGVGYGMDSMGRRTSITRPGGQNDSYGYDAAGQVTAGSYLATPSGNQSDGFAYDGTGNRTTSARNGVNVSYSANALEQYSAVGGAVPTYDAAGNTLSLPVPGGTAVEMTWDAENRMLSSTRNGAAVGGTVLPLASSLVNGARVVNRYDVLHRRVVKEVHAPNGSGGWTLQERRLFTYDGWNVIEERAFDAGGSLVTWQRLTWGRDASGRLQGAGGVGGLLLAEELPVSGVGSAVGHYPGYDGNGNVVLMTTGSGVVEGRWRYGAFGGTLGSVTASGGYAEQQPWRFSGKYLDGEVETRGGVYYYGYRHYVPEVGRWTSRDPIGEQGGVNLYGMVGNGCVNWIDFLGLSCPENMVQDSAGRCCCREEISSVLLSVEFQGVNPAGGHTWLDTEPSDPNSGAVGHYPNSGNKSSSSSSEDDNEGQTALGETTRRDDKRKSTSQKRYQVCPETKKKIEESINDHRDDKYDAGKHNCSHWACGRLEDAGIEPPFPSNTPSLNPANLQAEIQ
jgi:RHS repeat-associated protein